MQEVQLGTLLMLSRVGDTHSTPEGLFEYRVASDLIPSESLIIALL
jgi:hypothetical protein